MLYVDTTHNIRISTTKLYHYYSMLYLCYTWILLTPSVYQHYTITAQCYICSMIYLRYTWIHSHHPYINNNIIPLLLNAISVLHVDTLTPSVYQHYTITAQCSICAIREYTHTIRISTLYHYCSMLYLLNDISALYVDTLTPSVYQHYTITAQCSICAIREYTHTIRISTLYHYCSMLYLLNDISALYVDTLTPSVYQHYTITAQCSICAIREYTHTIRISTLYHYCSMLYLLNDISALYVDTLTPSVYQHYTITAQCSICAIREYTHTIRISTLYHYCSMLYLLNDISALYMDTTHNIRISTTLYHYCSMLNLCYTWTLLTTSVFVRLVLTVYDAVAPSAAGQTLDLVPAHEPTVTRRSACARHVCWRKHNDRNVSFVLKAYSHDSSQCSMTGVIKAVVCAILSMGWCIQNNHCC